jgi:hypothetical protein
MAAPEVSTTFPPRLAVLNCAAEWVEQISTVAKAAVVMKREYQVRQIRFLIALLLNGISRVCLNFMIAVIV